MKENMGASVPDQALVASDGAAAHLHPSGFDPSRLLFSKRIRVRDAIADPASVLPRGEGEGWHEEYAHWQTRAALKVLAEIANEYSAIAMEAAEPDRPRGGLDPKGDSAGPQDIAQNGSGGVK